MLNDTTAAMHQTITGAFSYPVPPVFSHKHALYRQIHMNAGLKPGQVILELCHKNGNEHQIKAMVNLVEADPMGGLPLLTALSPPDAAPETDKGILLSGINSSFDTILCIGIFNHLHNQVDVFGDIRRMLSPGGRLIIADQWFRKPGAMFDSLLIPYAKTADYRIYSPLAVIRLLKKSGFPSVEVFPAGATNFLCIARPVS